MAYLQVMDYVALSRECMVCMVRAGRSILVLGLTGHNISLLKEFSQSEIDDLSVLQVSAGSEPGTAGGFLAELKRQISERSKRFSSNKIIAVLLLGHCWLHACQTMLWQPPRTLSQHHYGSMVKQGKAGC